MPMTQINSDTLIPIEQNFRVSAGPGAGKTHWLVNHIKNVLHHSDRLGKTRKIACITYTNIAVEIILRALDTSANQVEVSTIHSFLYHHVVKPYASFIAMTYGLDVKKMDGHDDTILSSYPFLEEWKIRTKQNWFTDNKAIIEAIKSARWKFDEADNLLIKPDYPHKINGYSIKNDSYFVYKRMTWERGIIHHDDVLYFSYQLIQKIPVHITGAKIEISLFFCRRISGYQPHSGL